MNLQYADLINQIEETQVPTEGQSDYVQGEVVRLLWNLYKEAVEHGNIHADEALAKTTEFIQDVLLDTDLFSFEERMELRDRLEVISVTLGIAMQADEWGREAYSEDSEDPTEVAIPVLVADEFYEPLFDAVGRYLEAYPEPIPLSEAPTSN